MSFSVHVLQLLLLCSVSAKIDLSYTIQYEDGCVNISLQNANPLSTNQVWSSIKYFLFCCFFMLQVLNLDILGVSPLIRISTCTPVTPSQDGLLLTAHTLLTASHFTHSFSAGSPTLSILVPGYLLDGRCLEVAVDTLLLAPGIIVPAFRWLINHFSIINFYSLVYFRERIILAVERRNDSALFCSTGECNLANVHTWSMWQLLCTNGHNSSSVGQISITLWSESPEKIYQMPNFDNFTHSPWFFRNGHILTRKLIGHLSTPF